VFNALGGDGTSAENRRSPRASIEKRETRGEEREGANT